jgi:hypothetical protein
VQLSAMIIGFLLLISFIKSGDFFLTSANSEEPILGTASLCNIYFSSFGRNMIEVIFLGIYEYFTNCRSALYYYSDILNTDDDVGFSGRNYALNVAPVTIPARLTAPEVFINATTIT